MRAKPSKATAIRLLRILKGLHSFSTKDVARRLKRSMRTAERYIIMLKEVNAVELWYRGNDRYYYYRVRRKK